MRYTENSVIGIGKLPHLLTLKFDNFQQKQSPLAKDFFAGRDGENETSKYDRAM